MRLLSVFDLSRLSPISVPVLKAIYTPGPGEAGAHLYTIYFSLVPPLKSALPLETQLTSVRRACGWVWRDLDQIT